VSFFFFFEKAKMIYYKTPLDTFAEGMPKSLDKNRVQTNCTITIKANWKENSKKEIEETRNTLKKHTLSKLKDFAATIDTRELNSIGRDNV